jgi:peptidoglycan hydrolase CwlO-like protein
MRKFLLPLATIVMISQFSLAIAADPNLRQVQPLPMPPQRGGTIPQLQLTPDYLYQQITALQQQVAGFQAKVNALQSVVQITQNARQSKPAT